MLKDLLSSRKFWVFAIGVLTSTLLTIAGRLGIALTPEDAAALSLKVVGMASAYLVGQGMADHGVEAATVTAESHVEVATINAAQKPPTL